MWILDILPWWTWLIATFGIAGVVALAVLAPALAAALLQGFVKVLFRVIDTPIGAALAAGALMFALAWVWSGVRAENLCNERIAQMKADAKAAAVKRDAEIATSIEKKYRPQMDALQTEADERDKQVKQYEQQIAAAGGGKCLLGTGPLRLRDRRR